MIALYDQTREVPNAYRNHAGTRLSEKQRRRLEEEHLEVSDKVYILLK